MTSRGVPCGPTRTERRAAIDIGTNSVRLLVADVAASAPSTGGESGIVPVWRNLATPRLGRGVDGRGRLSDEAMDAAAAAVHALAQQAREYGAVAVTVIGTSALRDAANQESFTSLVRRRTGLDVRVLSGEEEAALAFLGAVRGTAAVRTADSRAAAPDSGASPANSRRAPEAGREAVFVLDVGGGSTELVRGAEDGAMHWALSVDVGAVRMTEQCVRSDPVSREDWARLVGVVQAKLQPLWLSLARRPAPTGQLDAPGTPAKGGGRLIAVGGTATTLAAMHRRLRTYDPDLVHGHTLSRADVAAMLEALKSASLAQRRTWPGLHPQRADIILAGAVIVHQVMAGLGARRLTVSESDLLEGVLLRAAAVVDP